MKVSFPHQEDPASTGTAAHRLRPLQWVLAIVAGLAIVLLFLAIANPAKVQGLVTDLERRWGAPVFGQDRGVADKWSVALGSFFRLGRKDLPEVPQLVIDVPFKEISHIYRKREEALAIGHLVQGPDDFVSGDIRLGDRGVPVKLRLKGDWTDHLQGRKWSFRIRVRDGDHLLGMRRFSIQHPETRGYQAELMYFELLRGLGVMTPRYEFVNVTLNGEAVGLMALEEFFAKELLEFQRRREGVIVRFDESLVWDSRDSASGETVGWNGSFDDFRSAAVDAFASTKIAESPLLAEQLKVAEGLLKGFASGRLTAAEVFDAQQLGRFIAASDVMGAWHATRWANVRFYLNPVTLKLEPVAFDATLQEAFTDERSIVNGEPLLIDMLRDPEVWDTYLETLGLLAGLAEEGILQSNLRAAESEWLPLLQTEFRMLGQFPLDYLAPRAIALRDGMQQLAANGPPELSFFQDFETTLYPRLAHFEIHEVTGGLRLQVENAIPRDVTVIDVAWVNDAAATRSAGVATALPLSVPPRAFGSRGQRMQLALLPQPPGDGWELETVSRITGRSWAMRYRPLVSSAALRASPLPSATLATQLQEHAFLSVDEDAATVRVATGDWDVSTSLVIEAGYTVVIGPGTTLRFARDAAFVSFSPLHLAGSETAVVALLPANDESWPGLVVMNATQKSILDHVVISRTHGVQMPGWSLTGGANFYGSEVAITNSRFLNSRGEDALNIINTNFTITDTWFKGTVSDAFDADFTRGTIRSTRFEDIGSAGGGDAIDISGSQVTVEDVEFSNITDKALSIGERSEMTATNVSASGVGTGAAAKDDSLLTLVDSQFSAASFAALTAYVKKPEYGPAKLHASNVEVTETPTPVIVQTGSELLLDGTAVETRDVDVDALYETIMRPGLRK